MEQLLKDPNIEPAEILVTILGDSLSAWQAFYEKLSDHDINFEWRYYKDGGWLAKGTHKKKQYFGDNQQKDFFT